MQKYCQIGLSMLYMSFLDPAQCVVKNRHMQITGKCWHGACFPQKSPTKQERRFQGL